jgi:hypothetical protein
MVEPLSVVGAAGFERSRHLAYPIATTTSSTRRTAFFMCICFWWF